jgi:hypothetical protein
MPEIYKIATLNNNGVTRPPRIAMLEDFLQKQEIDGYLTRTGRKRQLRRRVPKGPQKLKIDKKDDTPPVRRRSSSKTTGITSL